MPAQLKTLLSKRLRLDTLIEAYFEHARIHAPASFEWYERFVRSFSDRWPKVQVGALIPYHLITWLDENYEAQQKATRHGAISAVKRPFNWAIEMGLLKENPFAKAKKPRMPRRQRLLAPTEKAILLSNVADTEFRHVLTALNESGARPQDVVRVEASMIDWEKGIWQLPEHKAEHATGRP